VPSYSTRALGVALGTTLMLPRYSALADHLLNPVRGGPALTFPLALNIPRKVRRRGHREAGGRGGGRGAASRWCTGIASASAASMRSKGDPDSMLPLSLLQALGEDVR